MSRAIVPLDMIDVKTPCPASWEAMAGDDRVRFCEGCRRHVHNLSAMTRTEAESLLAGCAAAGRLCVRFARSDDGTVQTLDYRRTKPGRRTAWGWRFWTAFSACLAAGVGALNAYVFRMHLPPPFPQPPAPTRLVMGDFCPTPASPPSSSAATEVAQ
jgi:hypothetical protein